MKTSSTEEIKFVPKGWGFEKWIHNSELYCGKLLYFVKGKKCSWHYHKLKDEVFYVQSGRIKVYFGDSDDINEANTCILGPGDTELFEFSTQHFDSDSHRIEKGD